MRYTVMVGGIAHGIFATKADAEKRLNEIQHSVLAMVHPKDTIFIKTEKVF